MNASATHFTGYAPPSRRCGHEHEFVSHPRLQEPLRACWFCGTLRVMTNKRPTSQAMGLTTEQWLGYRLEIEQ